MASPNAARAAGAVASAPGGCHQTATPAAVAVAGAVTASTAQSDMTRIGAHCIIRA